MKTMQTRSATSITEAIRENAAKDPNLVLYTFVDPSGEEEFLTFSALDIRARAIASRVLNDFSHPRHQPALLLFPTNSRQFIESFYALLYADVPAVPLSLPRGRSDWRRIEAVLGDAKTNLILTADKHAASARQYMSPVTLRGVKFLCTDQLPDDDSGWRPAPQSYQSIAHLQYSSGSTGIPKGITVTHGNVLHNVAYIDCGFRHTSSSITLSWLPHFHDMGLIYGILSPSLLGHRGVLMTPMGFVTDPLSWLRSITKYRATHSGGPNFGYALCAKVIHELKYLELDLASWTTAFIGAETIHADVLARFAAIATKYGFSPEAFYPAYGLAEATLKVAGRRFGADCVRTFCRTSLKNGVAKELNAASQSGIRLVSNGTPSDLMRVAIVNAPGNSLPEDSVGEIWVAGPSVTNGYWGMDQDSKEVFQARFTSSRGPGFLRTGDLGFLHNAELFVVGRLKDLIIIRGENYYPDDIESAVSNAHKELKDRPCVAFHIDSDETERLVVVQEVHRHTPASMYVELHQAICARIRSECHIAPDVVALARQGGIPRTTSGKLRRSACKTLFLERALPMLAVYDRSLESDEATVTDFNRSEMLDESSPPVLDCVLVEASRISNNSEQHLQSSTTPFEVGLDSLQLAQLASKLRKFYGHNILLEHGWEHLPFTVIAEQISNANQKEAVPFSSFSFARMELELARDEKRLWAMELIYPNSPAHRITFAIKIEGRIEASRLESALKQIEILHPALRTGMGEIDGHLQRRLRDPQVTSRIKLSSAADGRSLHEAVQELVTRQMSLELGYVTNYTLWGLQQDIQYLLACIHHAVFDAISAFVFYHELARLYQYTDALSNVPVTVTSPPSCWLPIEEALAREFWSKYLTNASERVIFPWGEETKSPVGEIARVRHLSLPDQLYKALQEIAQLEQVSVYVVLLALLSVAWSRWSQNDHLTLTIPVSGRTDVTNWDQIGLYAHPIILALDWRGCENFSQRLKRIGNNFDQVLKHAELPFSEVVKLARPRGRAHHLPFMDVMFNYLRNPLPHVLSVDESLWSLVPLDTGVIDCFLSIFIYSSAQGEIQGWLKYPEGSQSDEFERLASTIENLLALFAGEPLGEAFEGNDRVF